MKKYNIITSIDKHILPNFSIIGAKKRMNTLLTTTKGQVPENFFSPKVWMDWLNTPGKMAINYGLSQLWNIAYTWYVSRIEYNIDPTVLKLVVDSELPEKFPTSVLKTIPLWTGYVNLESSPIPLYEGLITGILISRSLTENNQPVITITYPNLAEMENPFPGTVDILISDELTLKEIIIQDKGIVKAAKEFKVSLEEAFALIEKEEDHYIKAVKAFINIAFYIAASEEVEETELDVRHFIGRYVKINKRGEYQLPFRSALRQLKIGREDAETVNTIQYRNELIREYGQPHIRRGHYHGYWTGPRTVPDERVLKMKWLKPMVIKGKVKQ